MTFDQLLDKVQAAPGVSSVPSSRMSIAVVVSETLAALGIVVDEPTGQLIDQGKTTWKAPEQQNVRHSGMRSRRGKR